MPWYDFNGEVPEMPELWVMQSTPSCEIELFEIEQFDNLTMWKQMIYV